MPPAAESTQDPPQDENVDPAINRDPRLHQQPFEEDYPLDEGQWEDLVELEKSLKNQPEDDGNTEAEVYFSENESKRFLSEPLHSNGGNNLHEPVHRQGASSTTQARSEQQRQPLMRVRQPLTERVHLHPNVEIELPLPAAREVQIPSQYEPIVEDLVTRHLALSRAQRALNNLSNRGLPPFLSSNPRDFKPAFANKTKVLEEILLAQQAHTNNLTNILERHYNNANAKFQEERANLLRQTSSHWKNIDRKAYLCAREIGLRRSRQARENATNTATSTRSRATENTTNLPTASALRSPLKRRNSSPPSPLRYTRRTETREAPPPPKKAPTQPSQATTSNGEDNTETNTRRARELAKILTKYFENNDK